MDNNLRKKILSEINFLLKEENRKFFKEGNRTTGLAKATGAGGLAGAAYGGRKLYKTYKAGKAVTDAAEAAQAAEAGAAEAGAAETAAAGTTAAETAAAGTTAAETAAAATAAETAAAGTAAAEGGAALAAGGTAAAEGGAALAAGGAAVEGGAALAAGGAGAAALSTVLFPVAIGAAAVGLIYMAFRKAGWQEVAEDIRDASGTMRNRPELAAKLPTGKYFDLTTMSDLTDKEDMDSLIEAMNTVRTTIQNVKNATDYIKFVEEAKAQKPTLDLMCGVEGNVSKGAYFLLNEFGLNDRMYYCKCARVDLRSVPMEAVQKIQKGELEVPGLTPPNVERKVVSAPAEEAPQQAGTMSEILNNFKKFIIREQQENNLQAAESAGRAIGQATAAGIQNAAGQATAAAPVKYKCSPDTFPLFLPVSFETVGLEDDIADAPMGLNDLSVPPVPPITSGIINELCTAIEQANPPAPKPGPSPDPNPNPDEEPDPGSGKCKSCRLEKGCRGEEVKKLQDALMKNHVFLRFFPDPEYDKGVFGKRTETAVINFQKKKKLTVDGIAGTETFKALGVSCKGGKKTKKTDKPGKSGEPVCPQEGLGTPKCPYKYAELVNLQKQNNPGSVNGKMIYFYANTPSGTRSKAGVLFSSDGEPSGISGQGFPRMNSQEAKEYLKTDVIPRSVYERATSELDVQRKEQGLKEAKNLNYENYYDNKKQQEAKILFERLIKKI